MTPQARDLFVGRTEEMAQLSAVLDDAMGGRSGIALLGGEPGIGKTRLAEEIAGLARDQGAEVLWGRCPERASAPPYWPWIQVIREHILGLEPDAARLEIGDGQQHIAEIVPEVRRLFPDAVEVENSAGLERDAHQFLVLDSIAGLLRRAAGSRPLVIVLDDIHWADSPSLQLLEFAAQELRDVPLLILGTYRDADVRREHPLFDTLAAVSRSPNTHRVQLGGLNDGDAAQLAGAVAGNSLGASVLGEIQRRTEGNPLFIGEITRDLNQVGGASRDGTPGLPAGVLEAIGARLNRLSIPCNGLLGLAATIGPDFSIPKLKLVLDEVSDEELLSQLEEALAAQVISESAGGAGEFRFAHVLIQEVLVSEMAEVRMAGVHARLAEGLEGLYADDLEAHAAELAYHFDRARPVLGGAKTIHYSRIAGDAAGAAYAYEEAAGHFRRGLAASAEGEQRANRGELYHGLALALNPLGDRSGVMDALTRSFEAYMREGDKAGAIRAAGTGIMRLPGELPEQAELCKRGLDLTEPDSLDSARLLNEYGIALGVGQSKFAEGQDALARGLAIARREEELPLVVHILHNSGFIHTAAGESRQAIEKALELLDVSSELGIPGMDANAHRTAAIGFAVFAETTEAKHHAREALRCSSDRRAWGGRPIYDHWLNCTLALNTGGWQDAIEFDEMESRANGRAPRLGSLEVVQYMTGDQIAALDSLVENIEMKDDADYSTESLAETSSLIAEAGRRLGDENAISVADRYARHISNDSRNSGMSRDVASLASAIIAVARNNSGDAADSYSELQKFAGTLAPHLRTSCPDRILALLSVVRGDFAATRRHFESALELCKKAGYAPELGWTCLDYVEALLAENEDAYASECAALIERGLAAAGSVGMRPLEAQLLDLQVRVEVAQSDSHALPDGLTQREAEVLRLLAAGRTNQQIADELVIAPNTAAKHVANILGKTDSANRSEAGAYAHRMGLTEA